VFTIVATVGIVLAALYVLLVVQRTMHGPSRGVVVEKAFPDLRRRELAVVAPLVALILVLGVYPQPLLALIEPAVAATMTDVGSDPGGTPPVHEPVTAEQGAN
jgi:NADH-quinone oxidoreductase subunit M